MNRSCLGEFSIPNIKAKVKRTLKEKGSSEENQEEEIRTDS